MSLEQLIRTLAEEATAIAAAPISFGVACVIVGTVAFLIAKWAYSTIISHKDAQIATLDRMVKLRDDQLSGNFRSTPPEEARSIIDALSVKALAGGRQIAPGSSPKMIRAFRLQSGIGQNIDLIWDGLAEGNDDLADTLFHLLDKAGWVVGRKRVLNSNLYPKDQLRAGIRILVDDRTDQYARALSVGLNAGKLEFAISERIGIPYPTMEIGPLEDPEPTGF